MPRYIDSDNIYKDTDNGKDVFSYYFPSYDFNSSKSACKIRSDEKTASARIKFFTNNSGKGRYLITDFGNQEEISGMAAIEFVMYMEKLTYYEALCFIEQRILMRTVSDGSGYVKPVFTSEYRRKEVEDGDVVGEYKFTYKEPSKKDLEAIGPYITKECAPV